MTSLAEQIAALSNPKPVDIDPEDYERTNLDDENIQDDSLSREHYVPVTKSKMRNDDIDIDSKKYRGSRVSRKSLQEDNDSSSEEEIEHEDEVDDDDEDDNEDEGSDILENDFRSDSDEESENDDDVEQELGNSQSDISEDDDEPAGNDSHKREIFKELMVKEQKNIVSQLAVTAQQDATKGEAVQHQMNVYEYVLDSRIKAQKAIAAANKLPTDPQESARYSSDKTPEIRSSTEKSLYSLLGTICDLRIEMMRSDGVISQDTDLDMSKKRTYTAALSNASSLDSKLLSYRKSVLSKWSRKVQASSGASSLQSSKFKAFNQTADVQVNNILGDMDRLVKRTKLNRSNYVELGKEATEEEKEQRAVDKDNQVDSSLKAEGTHIFDDTDFYQSLLRELVDRRMADSQLSSGMKWTVTQSKVKKNVDTRASKGRKLRYHVQEKIQGFDAPRNIFSWTDDQADELFSSLLGQKLQVDENEPEESDNEDSEIENDGLAIFG